jgi:hypothetical protein
MAMMSAASLSSFPPFTTIFIATESNVEHRALISNNFKIQNS